MTVMTGSTSLNYPEQLDACPCFCLQTTHLPSAVPEVQNQVTKKSDVGVFDVNYKERR